MRLTETAGEKGSHDEQVQIIDEELLGAYLVASNSLRSVGFDINFLKINDSIGAVNKVRIKMTGKDCGLVNKVALNAISLAEREGFSESEKIIKLPQYIISSAQLLSDCMLK